jgi:hypothetical protein
MNKIITSEETDIEFDPESITDQNHNIISLDEIKNKRLEAIRELEAMLDNNDLFKTTPKQNKNDVFCFMRLETKHTQNIYNMQFKLISLNQTVIERTSVEIELEAPQKKLLNLFNFYQKNILKERRKKLKETNHFRVMLKKTFVSKTKKRRRLITKNDVYVTKIYAKINNEKLNLIDCDQDIWRINEMKYAFDNNRPTIKVLLVRNK